MRVGNGERLRKVRDGLSIVPITHHPSRALRYFPSQRAFR